jgi:ABC-2 type transport system permease protein
VSDHTDTERPRPRRTAATWAVTRREWSRLRNHTTQYVLLTVAPLLLSLLLAAIYRNHVVTQLPFAICDLDQTELSRSLVRAFECERSVRPVRDVYSIDDIKAAFRRGEIQGAVCIPPSLATHVKTGMPAAVTVYLNGSNIVVGNLITKAALGVTRTFSVGIAKKKLLAMGLSDQQAMDLANPIRLETVSLFNPGYNYLNYLVPALIVVLLQMIVMIVSAQLINAEVNGGTMHELAAVSRQSVPALVLGKTLPHFGLQIVSALAIMGIILPMYGIPFKGPVVAGVLFLAYFLLVVHVLGLALSAVVSNVMLAVEIVIVTNAPAFMFSGYTFPLEGMPGLQYAFAQILPFTHFLRGFTKVYLMGLPASSLWPEVGILSLFLASGLVTLALAVPRRLRLADRVELVATEETA